MKFRQAAALFGLLFCAFPVLAAPRPLTAGPIPNTPEKFDAPSIQALIDKADEDRNAAVLKIAYFRNGSKKLMPAADALALVKTAATTSTAGTRRWFALQSVLAYATLLAGYEKEKEALALYCTLFDAADQAEKAGAIDLLVQSTTDFNANVPDPFGSSGHDVRFKAVELKALAAYLKCLPKTPAEPTNLYWGPINKTYAQKESRAMVEAALKTSSQPLPYGLLCVAGQVFETRDPTRALAYMKQARQFLPQTRTDFTYEQSHHVAYVFAVMRTILRATRQWNEAVLEEKDYYALTGWSRSSVVFAQMEAGDMAGLDQTLDEMLKDTANDAEIVGTGWTLMDLNLPRKQRPLAQQKGAAFLASYLKLPTPRIAVEELRARFKLATYWNQEGKTAEALALVAVDALPQPKTTDSGRIYFDQIGQLRTMMEKNMAANTPADN